MPIALAPYIPPVRERLSSSAGYMEWARDVHANLMQAGLHGLLSLHDFSQVSQVKERFASAGLDAEQIALGYVNASCTGAPRAITEACSTAYEALALLQDVYTPALQAADARRRHPPRQRPGEGTEAYINRVIVAHDQRAFARRLPDEAQPGPGMADLLDARAAIDGLIDATFAADLGMSLKEGDDMVGVKLLRSSCLKDAHEAGGGVEAGVPEATRESRRSRGRSGGASRSYGAVQL